MVLALTPPQELNPQARPPADPLQTSVPQSTNSSSPPAEPIWVLHPTDYLAQTP